MHHFRKAYLNKKGYECMIRLIGMVCGSSEVCGVEGKFLTAVQSYIDSRVCARGGMDASEWFSVNDGLRQFCVMSLWLFNV